MHMRDCTWTVLWRYIRYKLLDYEITIRDNETTMRDRDIKSNRDLASYFRNRAPLLRDVAS